MVVRAAGQQPRALQPAQAVVLRPAAPSDRQPGPAGRGAARLPPGRQDHPASAVDRRVRRHRRAGADAVRLHRHADLHGHVAGPFPGPVRPGVPARPGRAPPRRVRRDPVPQGLGNAPEGPGGQVPGDPIRLLRLGHRRAPPAQRGERRRAVHRFRPAAADLRRVPALHRARGRPGGRGHRPDRQAGRGRARPAGAERRLHRVPELRRLPGGGHQRRHPRQFPAIRRPRHRAEGADARPAEPVPASRTSRN